MANHDYSIANQTAASARADINSALEAIVSNNSSDSEPTTTFANMWWVDTANDILKIRNEADTAWIEVGSINQTANTFSGGFPSGAVMSFAMSSAPNGWFKCNGEEKSRTVYSGLFAQIGTLYGSGDGSTTFNLPDLRGEFIRGWADTRDVDTGRAIATSQADEFKAHTHTQKGGGFNGSIGIEAGDRTTQNLGDTGSTGGTETRPRNIAMLYCIKY